jgi:hypothetical protein
MVRFVSCASSIVLACALLTACSEGSPAGSPDTAAAPDAAVAPDASGTSETATPTRVKSIVVTPAAAQIRVSETTHFIATALDGDGKALPEVTFAWTSSDPSIATVDGGGTVTGVGPGTAGIQASAEGITGSATVRVDLAGQKTYSLSVATQGSGSVESSPAGIQCPTTCVASYTEGTQVTLTAKPAAGWRFGSWSGACTGSGACAVTLSAPRSVGATFQSLGWDPSVGPADCQTAWANGKGLSPCDKVPDNYVVVHKSTRNLALCKAGANVTNFRVGLGFAPIGDKEKQGDGKTPEGVFYFPRLVPSSSYYKAFLISYPDKDDAVRGLTAGLITQAEKTQIDSAQNACLEPPDSTGLGGLVELHGNGGSQDWTWGCVAVEDSEIDQLWGVLGVGDTIVILP